MSLQVDDIVSTEDGNIAVIFRFRGCSHPHLKFVNGSHHPHYQGKFKKIGRVVRWKR